MFNAVQQALQWHGFLARGGQIVDAILVLVVSAVCSNAKGWEAIEDFGHAKLDGLHQYLPLANGVPSHDCIEYVMTRLSPVKFRECFINWMQAVKREVQEVIAFDGKTTRGSRDRANGGKPLHRVTADWKSAVW